MDKKILITNKDIGEKIRFEGIEFPVRVVGDSAEARFLSVKEGIAYFVNPSKGIRHREDAYDFGHILRDVCFLERCLAVTRPEIYGALSTRGYSEVDKFHSFEKFDTMGGEL